MKWEDVIKAKTPNNHIMMLQSLSKDMATMERRFSNVLGEEGVNLLNQILQLCDRKTEELRNDPQRERTATELGLDPNVRANRPWFDDTGE